MEIFAKFVIRTRLRLVMDVSLLRIAIGGPARVLCGRPLRRRGEWYVVRSVTPAAQVRLWIGPSVTESSSRNRTLGTWPLPCPKTLVLESTSP